MIYYLLGLSTGLILALFMLVALNYFRPSLERTINKTISLTGKKGEILEPENDDVRDWVESLKKE
jgi:hypothetical protein